MVTRGLPKLSGFRDELALGLSLFVPEPIYPAWETGSGEVGSQVVGRGWATLSFFLSLGCSGTLTGSSVFPSHRWAVGHLLTYSSGRLRDSLYD